MTRILSDDVVEVFRRRGIKAEVPSSWFNAPDSFCASGGVAYDKLEGNFNDLVELVERDGDGYHHVAKLLGVTVPYLLAFTAGYDSRETPNGLIGHDVTAEEQMGYEDGVNARRALVQAGLVKGRGGTD